MNLSGQNTFTGPITVTNSKGLTGGAYATIGGEEWTFNARRRRARLRLSGWR